MNDAGLFCVRLIGAIAVREQYPPFDGIEPEQRFHVRVRTTCTEGEADFIVFAVDRPEVTALHRARAGPASLDRGLIHGLDARGANRCQLRFVDRIEQRAALCAQLRQPRPADPDAGVFQALMLPVERQMPGKLVEQQADDEAHVGAAAFDDANRRRRAMDRFALPELDHRAHVLEDHVAARALRQTVADLLADDLVRVRRQPFDLGVGDGDRLDRCAGVVKEQGRFVLCLREVSTR